MRYLLSLPLALLAPCIAAAKPIENQPVIREDQIHRQSAILPAGSPIMLQMMQTVTTQGGSWQVGDSFSLRVLENLCINDHVVVPRGTLAFGHVRWSTGRGLFGKPGKLEVEIDHLVLGGKEVQLTGIHRRSGTGGIASAGTFVAAGLFAPFITGKSGEVAEGSALQAFLAQDLRVVLASDLTNAQVQRGAAPVVRARRISVAEAFSPNNVEEPVKAASHARVRQQSVSEAFAMEIRSLNRLP